MGRITERAVEFAFQHRSEIDRPDEPISELDADAVGPNDLEGLDLVHWMFHAPCLLLERVNLARRLATLQALPSQKQLSLMDLCPCFHEPSLPQRQAASDALDRIDRKNPDVVLILGMEVRPIVRRCGLGKHPDDDPEEAGDLWHLSRLQVSQTSIEMILFEFSATSS